MRRFAALVAGLALIACAPEATEEDGAAASESQLAGDSAFKEAKGKLEEIKGDLASAQGHLRGVLTPEQAKDYSAAFWKLDRVVAASEDYAKKTLVLAANLARETAALDADSRPMSCGSARGAADARVTKARDLYANAKSLATSNVAGADRNSPAFAVRGFYTYLLKNGVMLRCLSKTEEDLEEDLGANHAQVMVQVALEEPNATPAEIVRATFEPLEAGSLAVKRLAVALESFASTQDAGAFAKAATLPVHKLSGGVLALLSIGDRASELAEGRYRDFLKGALEGGAEDVKAIAEAVTLLEGVVDSGRMRSFLTRAESFAKLAGRIAAGVGIVTNLITLVEDIESYESDRLLYIARIAADAAALQACIVTAVGLASLIPAAGAIVLLTQTVLVIAQYWHEHQAALRRTEDTKAVLRSIGFADRVADMLAAANEDTLGALTGEGEGGLGLDPTSLQSLAKFAVSVPRGAEAYFVLADNPLWISHAAELKRLFALDDAESVDMITKTAGTEEGAMARVVFNGCFSRQPGVYASKKGVFDALTACKGSGQADEIAATGRLESFLRAHP